MKVTFKQGLGEGEKVSLVDAREVSSQEERRARAKGISQECARHNGKLPHSTVGRGGQRGKEGTDHVTPCRSW